MKAQRKLNFDEHYILQNLGSFIIQYLLLWVVAIGLAFAASQLIGVEPDATLTKTFAASTTTLSVTTITFALPTCMRTIFAAYETYHSTTIRMLLIQRFPITLLSLSSFTSLLVSLLVVSGIAGIYLPINTWAVLTMTLFWALVCVFYLFCAIEKMVHFVVKAPNAVLDKLEFNIYDVKTLESDAQYDEFRSNLASMSDVAATIVRNSTGKDETISRYLNRLRDIHRIYATSSIAALEDQATYQRHRKACYACSKELTKLYREAAHNHNGDITRSVLKTYCGFVADCVNIGCSRNYLTELTGQVQRFQSYANVSLVTEIREQATTRWFFWMLAVLKDVDSDNEELVRYAKHCIVREMLMTLRRATLANNEEMVVSFARLASNSDLEINLDLRSREWLAVVDRTVLLYLNWLLVASPAHVEDYLGLLRRYSLRHIGDVRPLFCDTVFRLKELLKLERFDNDLARKSGDYLKKEVGTAALMDLPLGIDAARYLSYLVELTYIDLPDAELLAAVPDLNTVIDNVQATFQDSQGLEHAIELAHLACANQDDLDRRFFNK